MEVFVCNFLFFIFYFRFSFMGLYYITPLCATNKLEPALHSTTRAATQWLLSFTHTDNKCIGSVVFLVLVMISILIYLGGHRSPTPTRRDLAGLEKCTEKIYFLYMWKEYFRVQIESLKVHLYILKHSYALEKRIRNLTLLGQSWLPGQ